VKKRLFRFYLKRNGEIGSEKKSFWKGNKAKICCINFDLSEAKNLKRKEAKKKKFRVSVRHACQTDLVLLRFASKREFFFAKPAHPTRSKKFTPRQQSQRGMTDSFK
jgi:hypothetical protein